MLTDKSPRKLAKNDAMGLVYEYKVGAYLKMLFYVQKAEATVLT